MQTLHTPSCLNQNSSSKTYTMILRAVVLVEFAFLLMWSSGFVGAKYGLAGAGTFTLLFWRYLLLSAVLFPFALGLEHLRTEWNADFIFALGWLTFVVSLAAYGMLIFLFKHRRAPVISGRVS